MKRIKNNTNTNTISTQFNISQKMTAIDPSIISMLAKMSPTTTITTNSAIATATSNNNIRRRPQQQQAKTVLFVYSLFKYLESSAPHLVEPTRKVIQYCRLRNRMKDPHFLPLSNSILIHVRNVIGPQHWECARSFFRLYVTERKNLRDHQKKLEHEKRMHQKLQQQKLQLQQQLQWIKSRRESFTILQQPPHSTIALVQPIGFISDSNIVDASIKKLSKIDDDLLRYLASVAGPAPQPSRR